RYRPPLARHPPVHPGEREMSRFQTIKPSSLDRDAFVATFADIYEHSPWGAEQAYDQGVDESLDDIEMLHRRMSEILLNAPRETHLALINAHPDLAGKAAVRGQQTASSASEQAGAGIHDCSAEEFERFTELNADYKHKFGFIIIMAVKGSNRHEILAAFKE